MIRTSSLRKVRFLLEYGEAQGDYRSFLLYNTGGEDYDTALNKGTVEEKTIQFDPHATISGLLQRSKSKPEELPPVLALHLGNYYYRVYQNYPETWLLKKEEVRTQALRWYELAEKNSILVGESEIRGYATLLIEEGKADKAISLVREKIQFFSTHDESGSENLWWFLIDLYSRGGRPVEAFKELDERIRLVSSGKSSTDLASLYEKGAEIAIHHARKPEFERYVTNLEKTVPDKQMQWGALRHRFALRTGDPIAASALAERLYQRYPVTSILKENVLEMLMQNYLLFSSYRKEGLEFLDRQIKTYQKDSKRLFDLYMYRSAYRLQIHVNNASEKDPQKAIPHQVIQESIQDLKQAESLYKSFKDQDPEILSILDEWSKELGKFLQSNPTP